MPEVLPTVSIEEVTRSAVDPFAVLNTMLSEYNLERVGPANHVPLWLFVRDASGNLQGGVRGQTYWSWCTIDVLCVAEPYRRQGIGSRCFQRRKRLRGRAVVLEFGSTPQAFKHLSSISGTDIRSLAASKSIRQVIRGTGS